MQVIVRADAIKRGLNKYFTGKPCKNGHVDQRWTKRRHCVTCHANVSRAYRAKNPERVREINRKWKQEHPENVKRTAQSQGSKARSSERYKNNSERLKQMSREWKKANPDKVLIQRRNRRAKAARASGTHTAEELIDLLTKQNHCCANCFCSIRKKKHLDHIVPISRGGRNDIANLQYLCPSCNCSKGAKDPIEWALENGRLL